MTTTAKPTSIPAGLLAGVFLLLVGGFVDGAVEGFEFDGRLFFELKYNASKTGFWGHESWAMVYVDGDPSKGFKTLLHRWLGAVDFYHVCDDLRKAGYIIGGMLTGAFLSRFDGWKRYGAAVVLLIAASSAKALAMWAIRM